MLTPDEKIFFGKIFLAFKTCLFVIANAKIAASIVQKIKMFSFPIFFVSSLAGNFRIFFIPSKNHSLRACRKKFSAKKKKWCYDEDEQVASRPEQSFFSRAASFVSSGRVVHRMQLDDRRDRKAISNPSGSSTSGRSQHIQIRRNR